MNDETIADRASLPTSVLDQVDRLFERFEAAQESGTRPRVEEYLDAVATPYRPTLLTALLASEIGARRRRDERPDPEEYRGRFPGHPAAVEKAFAAQTIRDESRLANTGPPGSHPGSANTVPMTGDAPGATEAGSAPAGERLPLTVGNDPHADASSGGQDEAPGTAGCSPPGFAGRLPRFLGEYEILEKIAEGGMGIVCRARQDKLNRVVALKLIRSLALASGAELRRFWDEAKAMAELDHPNIIPIYEIGQEDGVPYLSMKLIEGGNLSRHIARLRNNPDAVAALISKVARAVHYAHQRTVLHRDIKPSNILVGDRDEPYVTDFGLAKRIGIENALTVTVTGAPLGTPAYMPPEQARGLKVTTAADVYSLGATLYETLTGQAPFTGTSPVEIMRQVLDQEPLSLRSINPALDRDLETICVKCLEKDPARRFGSAEALADELDRWREGKPLTIRPVSTREKALKWVKRRPELAALALVSQMALVGLLGGGIWFTLQLRSALDLANRGRYAADLSLARRALEDGLFYQVREQLKLYRTGPASLSDLRSFEWHYLANLCDRSPIRLRGHEKAVICVAFHPDGNRVVSGGEDGTVRVWDLSNRRPPLVLTGKGGTVRCVAVSPDGRWLAAGDTAGGLRLWELETRQERTLPGHEGGLRSVAFSPDGLHLLSCAMSGLIVQWGVMSGKHEFELPHQRREERIAPIVTGTNTLEGFGGTMATYAPDGKTIVSAGNDQWVMIWDVATHRLRDEVQVGANIYGFSISPDGRELAMAEQMPMIRILDLDKPRQARRSVRSDTFRLFTVTFNPDPVRRTLATAGFGIAELLDVEKGRVLDIFDDRVNSSPFSMAFGGTKGSLLAMAVGDEIHVVRLDQSLKGATVAGNLGPIRRLAVSSDERLLAVGRDDGTIVVWDVREKRIVQKLSGHGLTVFGLAFVPHAGGARLASVGNDGLKIWDPEAGGQPLFPPASGARALDAVAVRPPDGRQIATGGQDGMVRTWDSATGRADLAPLDHGAPVSALAYDAAGTILASGGMDKTVRVWSATSGRRRLGPLFHSHQITSLAFSPDGRLLAGGGSSNDKGGKILIWDTSWGRVKAEIDCPRGVNCLSFSADSRRIATCGSDAVVQVWDAASEVETLSLDGHTDRVSAVLFAPHDLRLYSAGRDGFVKLWDGGTTAPAE